MLTNPYHALLRKGMCHRRTVQDLKLNFPISCLDISRKVAIRELNFEEPLLQRWHMLNVEHLQLLFTLCFLYFRNFSKVFSKLPATPFWFDLKITSLCQTLSKALDMSRKTPLTSIPLSKDWYISWVIENSWLIHKCPALKPDWLEEINSFLLKCWYNLFFYLHNRKYILIKQK